MKDLVGKQKGGLDDELFYEKYQFPLENTMGNMNQMKISVSADGSRVATTNYDESSKNEGYIYVCDSKTGEVKKIKCGGAIWSVAIFPDGNRVVSGTANGLAKIWDANSGALLHTFSRYVKRVYGIEVSPDGKKIVIISDKLRVYDVDNLTLLFENRPSGPFDFSRDSQRLIIGGNTIRVLNINNGNEIYQYEIGRSSSCCTVKLSPNGKKVVTGYMGGDIIVSDLETREKIQEFKHQGNGSTEILAAVISLDEKYVISWSEYVNTIKVWKIESGEEIQTVDYQPNRSATVYSGVLPMIGGMSSDGTIVATWSRIYVKVWELDGKMVLTRKASDVVDKIGLNDDILEMIKDKLQTSYKELNNLWK